MQAHNQLELASVSLVPLVVIYTHNNGNKMELFCFKYVYLEYFCLETVRVNILSVCFAVLKVSCVLKQVAESVNQHFEG